MKDKKLYNYRKALHMPYMVQKLWKNFSLQNPLPLERAFVFTVVFASLFISYNPIVILLGLVPGFTTAGRIIIPIAITVVWDRLEPDGKKIPRYLLDWIVYTVQFRLMKRKYTGSHTIDHDDEIVTFEKIG